MKIVLTGSAGFIGGHLADRLIRENAELILLDLETGTDICNWDQVKDLSGFDAIIHLANRSFVPDSFNFPHGYYHTNIISTLNMLELCKNNNAKFIYLSSYIYGIPEYLPIDEQHPISAFNPYAQSKVICEQLCEGYNRDFHVPVIIFRPFNIYGKGQNEIFLIPKMIRQAKEGEIIIMDDRPKRDYIYISDVVNAIVQAIDYQPEGQLDIFNLGSGISYSVKEVADFIISFFPENIKFKSLNKIRPNEVMNTIANIEKAKKLLNWQPSVEISDGLTEILNESFLSK